MDYLKIIVLILLGLVVIMTQRFIRINMANIVSKIFDKEIKPKYEKRKRTSQKD